MSLEDEIFFTRQVTVIREWATATVAVVIALYEPETPPDDLQAKVDAAGESIFERVLGNRINSPKMIVWDDPSLKKLYKRIVEATLRWCIEKSLEL